MHIPSHPRHGGFTLIEMLIAVALGALVVYTALAGFRTLSQAVTASRQLAIENALLRTGMALALEEVDFWNESDDPDDAARQQMRGTSGRSAGMPFTPFRLVDDPLGAGPFIDSRPGMGETTLGARTGWNPNPLAWAAWDPRTWTRANLPEEHNTFTSWGNYGLYENLDPARSAHHWYGNQVHGTLNALGFFGAYDYLPSNSFLADHSNQLPAGALGMISWGGLPEALTANGAWLAATDGGDHVMKGRVRNTNGSRYFIPSRPNATVATCRSLAKIGYNGRDTDGGYAFRDARRITDFLKLTGVARQAMPVRPEHWPEVSATVHRFIERGHPVTLCVVACVHPVTGARLSIPFTTVGTTLRGARQQRLPQTTGGNGWADPYAGPTLDYDNPP
jgi:prepilin-type N-terminal cleavage/methylation domain-containing protein